MRRPRPSACRISVLDGAIETMRRAPGRGALRFDRQPSRRMRRIIVRSMQTSEVSIVVELDVPVPMRDGVLLRANVYRPPDGRWPVLLTRLPYGKDLPLGTAVLDPTQVARRGYVVIVQDTRGRLTSEGDWKPFQNEDLDGFDTIEWASKLPYSNGSVGMYGIS